MNILERRAANVAIKFMKARGMSIIDDNVDNDIPGVASCILADDDGALVFAFVKVSDNKSDDLPKGRIDRKAIEKLAVSELKHVDGYNDCPVRFDEVAMTMIGEERAFVRHTINLFGISEER